ncbi:MAG: sulfatase [Haloplanus sp.]
MTEKPNVLFLVLDAVRSDHLSCYGYDRETTPNIDALAADGVRYEHAISPSIWTPPVHGAIYTGQYPSHVGIQGDSLSIPEGEETVPEALAKRGYRTFTASSGAHIRATRGYDRGVDDYVATQSVSFDWETVRRCLTDRAFAKQVGFTLTRGPDDMTQFKFGRLRQFMADAIDDEQPFYGFVNAKVAHQPFDPPRPYKRLFCSEYRRPPYEFLDRAMSALGVETERLPGTDREKVTRVAESGGDGVIAGETELTEEEWAVVEAWYDGAIRYLDDVVGSVVDFLRDRDAFDDTLLVVTSDHGDNFGDHGLTSHIFCLYDTLVRVPLIVSPPRDVADGTVVDGQVSLIDLEPTFREAAGAPRREYPHSESLLDFEDRRYHEYTFSEYAGFHGPIRRLERKYPEFDPSGYARGLQSVRDDEYKLVVDSAGDRELYAWREDPAEQTNLLPERSDTADRLEAVLDERLGALTMPEGYTAPDDAELEAQLKDLGYL